MRTGRHCKNFKSGNHHNPHWPVLVALRCLQCALASTEKYLAFTTSHALVCTGNTWYLMHTLPDTHTVKCNSNTVKSQWIYWLYRCFFVFLWLLNAPIKYYAAYNCWYNIMVPITRKIPLFEYCIFHNHEICWNYFRISFSKLSFMAVIAVWLVRFSMPMNIKRQTHNENISYLCTVSIEK